MGNVVKFPTRQKTGPYFCGVPMKPLPEEPRITRTALLVRTLRNTACPYPTKGEPDDQTAGECCDKGLCGCEVGVALGARAIDPSEGGF